MTNVEHLPTSWTGTSALSDLERERRVHGLLQVDMARVEREIDSLREQLRGAVADAADLVRLAHLPDKAMTQGDWLHLRELTRKYAPDHPANGER